MSLVNLSVAYERMRAHSARLQDALTDAQISAGLLSGRIGAANSMRYRAETTLLRAVRRVNSAEAELADLKDLLVKAVIHRDMAAAEWLVTVAEARADMQRADPTIP